VIIVKRWLSLIIMFVAVVGLFYWRSNYTTAAAPSTKVAPLMLNAIQVTTPTIQPIQPTLQPTRIDQNNATGTGAGAVACDSYRSVVPFRQSVLALMRRELWWNWLLPKGSTSRPGNCWRAER